MADIPGPPKPRKPPPVPRAAPSEPIVSGPNVSGDSVGNLNRFKKRGVPIGFWIGIGMTALAATVLGVVLVILDTKNDQQSDQTDEMSQREDTSKESVAEIKSSTSAEVANKTIHQKPIEKKIAHRRASSKSMTAAASLRQLIRESIALLEKQKVDEFLRTKLRPGARSLPDGKQQENRLIGSIATKSTDRLLFLLKRMSGEKRLPLKMDADETVARYHLAKRGCRVTGEVALAHRDNGQWYFSATAVQLLNDWSPYTDGISQAVYELERRTGRAAVPFEHSHTADETAQTIKKVLALGGAVAVGSSEKGEPRFAVYLGKQYTGGEDGVGLLPELAGLEVLILDSPPGMKDGLMALAELKDLRILEITSVHGAAPIGVYLQDSTMLEELRLFGYSDFGDPDIGFLSRLTRLRRLDLVANEITDEGTQRLAVLNRLQYLNLSRRREALAKTAIKSLREAIPGAKIISDLSKLE